MEVIVVRDKWLKGWEAIKAFTGYATDTAVKNLQKRYHFPLRCLPTGEPVVIESEANEWLRAFSEASSPFRKRKLTGAALRAYMQGREQEQNKEHNTIVKRNEECSG